MIVNGDLNRGDVVFQAWSGRLGIVLETGANTNGTGNQQQQFDWHARVVWFSNKVSNNHPLGQEYVLSNSLNLISKAQKTP